MKTENLITTVCAVSLFMMGSFTGFYVCKCGYEEKIEKQNQLESMVKLECAKAGVRYPFVVDSTRDYVPGTPYYHHPDFTEFEVREGLRKRGDLEWNYACEVAERKIKAEGGRIGER
jgi:hypothetical protein